MSLNPFLADAAKRQRFSQLSAALGGSVADAITELVEPHTVDAGANMGSVLAATDARELAGRFGLADIRELMVLGLAAAQRIARPPISDFHVGAIGLEVETGNLILGGNVEFPGTTLANTLHGEGFVATRAFSRDTTISVLAIGEAHPCAHCRQYLSEFAASKDLVLIDPLGHELTMAQLYPWPFDPDYLGEPGVVAGDMPYPGLTFLGRPPDAAVAEALLAAGHRAHTPYGKCPTAVVLQLQDGTIFAGSAIESVAFNPGISPLQAAIVDLLAHGRGYDEIAACWLGSVPGGRVQLARSVVDLLSAIAPAAQLTVCDWR